MAERILELPVTEIAESAFIDYAVEVIVSRALPDVRDGLKPVQRRILWSMFESGFLPESKFRKCARIVGDTMGKYHPHGDGSIYDALVKLEQPFVRRYQLVDGHGNFGSTDDNAAAMRYTEARLGKAALLLMDSIKKDTVDFIPNFDESEKEPSYLPARVPNLLINGTSGIAVGMASSIPTHNMTEILNATIALIKKRDASTEDLMKYVKGPDFSTGGIMDPQGILECYETGRGAVAIRGKVSVEAAPQGCHSLIIKSLPYGVKAEGILSKIANLVYKNNLEFVTAISNESSTEVGMRLRIDLNETADIDQFIKLLFAKTPLQSNFNFNMNALVNGKPKQLPLKEILLHFIDHRRDIFTREMTYDLNKALHRSMILEGLQLAIDQLDAVIALIRNSKSVAEAKKGLIDLLKINSEQAQAILDLKLSRLTQLDIKALKKELDQLKKQIAKWQAILASEKKIDAHIIKDIQSIMDEKVYINGEGIKEDNRMTEVKAFSDLSYSAKVENVIVCGEKKKYSTRKRIGKFTGPNVRTDTADEVVSVLENGTSHNFHAEQSLSITEDANIVSLLSVKEMQSADSVLFITSDGMVKRTAPGEIFGGKTRQQIIKLKNDAHLVGVQLVRSDAELYLVTKDKMCIHFKVSDVPMTGRVGMGVVGIKLKENDVVSYTCTDQDVEAIKAHRIKGMKLQKRAGKGNVIKV